MIQIKCEARKGPLQVIGYKLKPLVRGGIGQREVFPAVGCEVVFRGVLSFQSGCSLGWQESLVQLAQRVEPEIPQLIGGGRRAGGGRAMCFQCAAAELQGGGTR